MRGLAIIFLKVYSRTLSNVFYGLGARCRFHPTCSEYARQAFETRSTFEAFRLVVIRLMKCGPWHDGGIDEVPETGVERIACSG